MRSAEATVHDKYISSLAAAVTPAWKTERARRTWKQHLDDAAARKHAKADSGATPPSIDQ